MSQSNFSFHAEDLDFELENQDDVRAWLEKCVLDEGLNPGEISYVFTGDESLLEMNQKYLNHDTYTDVIGFDYSEGKTISGDIYISIERVRDNALKYSVNSRDELHRVMIHGLLHFCGYSDDNPDDKAVMTGRENYCLSLRAF